MDKKTRPIYILPPRDPSQIKRYTQTKSKGLEKDISYKWKRKIAGLLSNKIILAILISYKIDFKTKAILRDKEIHYIMVKGTIQQEDITLVNNYAPNIGAPKYVKQILMNIKGEINRNTVIVEDFNTPLTSMDRPPKQKINKEAEALNDTLDQIDLIDNSRTFHPQTAEYTYFASEHEMFSRIEHMFGHNIFQ